MPYSQSLQTCDHCREIYVSGDSIEFRCGSCRRKGHTTPYEKCLICAGKQPEGKDPMANFDTLLSMMKRRQG
jgi:uncharacterized radical SAM superfamily protein